MHPPQGSLVAHGEVARGNRIGPGTGTDQRDAARRDESLNVGGH